MSAFEKGWAAAESGKPLKDNPYLKWSGEWLGWRNGWHACFYSFGISPVTVSPIEQLFDPYP